MTQKIVTFLKEGGWLLLVAGLLYLSGWHTETIGFLQRGLLATGLFSPATEVEQTETVDLSALVLYDEDGNRLPGQALEGKLIFLNVWASWCPPCLAEMPGINALYKEMGKEKELVFLMASVDKEFGKAIKLRDRKGFDFPIFQVQSLPGQLQSQSIPATYVISKEGKLAFLHEGMADYNSSDFKEKLQALLKQPL